MPFPFDGVVWFQQKKSGRSARRAIRYEAAVFPVFIFALEIGQQFIHVAHV